MKINRVNNTCFQGLHASPETLNKIGCTKEMLMKNSAIKECAEKFDVLVTAGTKKYVIGRQDGFTKDKFLPTAYLIGTVWSAPHMQDWLVSLGITNLNTVLSVGFTMLAMAGLSILKIFSQKFNEINIQGTSKVEKQEAENINSIYNDGFITKGASTQIYTARRTPNGLVNINEEPDLAGQIHDIEYKNFYTAGLKDINLNDMYTPTKYLKEFQKIKENLKVFNIEDVFKYPINRGGDTLLTTFFDIAIPDKSNFEEMEAYYTILHEIAKTNKNNFSQKDARGISIIEKIMNSENEYVLPFIRGCKFSYSPYLKPAYENIQNEMFKKQLDLIIDLNFDLLE